MHNKLKYMVRRGCKISRFTCMAARITCMVAGIISMELVPTCITIFDFQPQKGISLVHTSNTMC
jgi:hypothetical protein